MKTFNGEPWVLCFDGLTEPRNPGGVMAWGWAMWTKPGAGPTETGGNYVPAKPDNTNNRAEYGALYYGLLSALEFRRAAGADYPGLIVRGDSKLVVEQMNRRWNCNTEPLRKARDKCAPLVEQLEPCEIEWIPREDNHDADALSRAAYRQYTGHEPPERHGRKAG